MRRARIKAVATVPVRRKNTQDVSSSETANTPKTEEKEKNTDSVDIGISKSVEEDKQIEACQHLSLNDSQVEATYFNNNINIHGHETLNQCQNDLKEVNEKEHLEKIRIQNSEMIQIQDFEKIHIQDPEKIQLQDFEKIQLQNSEKIQLQDSEKIQLQDAEKIQLQDPEKTQHQVLEKIQIQDHEKTKKSALHSENSYTTEIVSPTKIAQGRSCFMRPVPRLDSSGRVRRNSIHGSGASASESEDDTKRITCTLPNRIRNDSVCSVQSTKENNSVANQANVTNLKSNKRRILVSESARKLAEARREFLLKHENKTPDRSKLTMYDLIYYNPVSNPMKKSQQSMDATRKLSFSQPEEIQEDESEDDPMAMPVPQVKVGPDGQLIIDEQSLVIEQTSARKNKAVLAKEAIVYDDSNGSGFYKRRQKSKEWSRWETLKFYKALNTVGTDFLLMQSLFPNRTRQEIKLKYKKEEKVNRKLVEKALVYHQEFDTESLEKELATFEATEREKSEKIKLELKDKKKLKPGNKRLGRLVASSIAEMDASEDDDLQSTIEQNTCREANNNKFEQKRRRRSKQKCKKILQPSVTEVANVESLSSDSESGSDVEIYQIRPTRSGRLPKVRKLQGPEVNTLDSTVTNYSIMECKDMLSSDDSGLVKTLSSSNIVSKNSGTHCPDAIKTAIPDISQVEPGSLVILSKESSEEPGKTVLQVYMVSSNVNASDDQVKHNITPIDLSPELLATVTTKLSDVDPICVKEEGE